MVRALSAALASLLLSSAAWSQVIYAPPESCDCYPEGRVTTDSRELIWSWRRSQCNMIFNNPYGAMLPPQPYVQSGILIIPSGSCISPEALGIDPQTGQPLYFRKRDFLPPAVPADAPPTTQRMKLMPPATQPVPEHQGEMVIRPWRGSPGGGEKLVSR